MAGKLRADSIARTFDNHYAVNENTGCHEWRRAIKRDGYGYLYDFERSSVVGAHVFSYERKHGRVPNGMHVCHRCDNKKCVNEAHLFLGTNTDNRLDSVNKRHHAFGDRHGMAKLALYQAEDIKRIWQAGGVSQHAIASKFEISQAQVSRIICGKRWAA